MEKYKRIGWSVAGCGVGSINILDGLARWYKYVIKLNDEHDAKEKDMKKILKCHANLILASFQLGAGIGNVALGTKILLNGKGE